MNNNNQSNSIRKIRKPLMEKKRRARINDSLETLKQILLKNTVAITQGCRPTKLEKADILEMTVRYLQVLHKRLSTSNQIANSLDCGMVTSTTSSNDSLKSLSFGTGNPYSFKAHCHINVPLKRESGDDKENNLSTETVRLVQIQQNDFRSSHQSAFKVIEKNVNFRKNNDKENIEPNDHWRPW